MRTVMLGIAFLALILALFVETIRLQRAAVRAELLRAESEQQRAVAEAEARRARAVLDRLLVEPDRSGEKRRP
jgi:hypothetical protein